MSGETTQMHVLITGHVQGVGFRHSTSQIAKSFEVAGWVKNLSSGEVEIVAEGTKTACSDFLTEIRQRMFEYVSEVNCEWRDASGEFDKFEIRY